MHGTRHEIVTDKDGDMIVPYRVDGRTVASRLRVVDDVVVDEGCVVKQFDRRRRCDGFVVGFAEQLRAKNHDDRSYLLA